MIVKNISISDVVSGQIIFQRVYSWRNSSAFSNLGSLIQVFYQFAREVDDGEIKGINFDAAPKSQFRKMRDDTLKSGKSDTMHMTTAKTDEIIVSIFFDMKSMLAPSVHAKNQYQVLLHAIIMAFESRYLADLQEYLGPLRQAVQNNEDGQIENLFPDFTEVVDHLCVMITKDVKEEDPGIIISAALSTEAIDEKARDYINVLGIMMDTL